MNRSPYFILDDNYEVLTVSVEHSNDINFPIRLLTRYYPDGDEGNFENYEDTTVDLQLTEAFNLGMELVKRSGISQHKSSTFDYMPTAESQQEIEDTMNRNRVDLSHIPDVTYP